MEPPTLIDQPFPLITGGFTPAVGQSTDPVTTDSGAITPETNVDIKFPVANVAQETLSQSLNTETKRILGAYTFEQLGALSIGAFSQGVSGEIKISPDGIAAKNINGDETFTLDGATGDATFSGTIKAGDVQVIDENGLVSLENFAIHSGSDFSNFSTNSAAPVEIPGISLTTKNFIRPVTALIFYSAALFGTQTAVPGSSFSGQVNFGVKVNGLIYTPVAIMRSAFNAGPPATANADITTISNHLLLILPAGASNLKLVLYADQLGVGNFTAACQSRLLSYIVLGQ